MHAHMCTIAAAAFIHAMRPHMTVGPTRLQDSAYTSLSCRRLPQSRRQLHVSMLHQQRMFSLAQPLHMCTIAVGGAHAMRPHLDVRPMWLRYSTVTYSVPTGGHNLGLTSTSTPNLSVQPAHLLHSWRTFWTDMSAYPWRRMKLLHSYLTITHQIPL